MNDAETRTALSTPPKRHFGHVYVAEFADGRVKVGMSADPSARVKTLATQSGVSLRRAWVSPWCTGHRGMEREAHEVLDAYRGIGEYFSIPFDEAVRRVESLSFTIVDDDVIADEIKRRDAAGDSAVGVFSAALGWNRSGSDASGTTMEDALLALREALANGFTRPGKGEVVTEYFTILGWAIYVKQRAGVTIEDLTAAEHAASEFCLARRIPVGVSPDTDFQQAGNYPGWVIEEVLSKLAN